MSKKKSILILPRWYPNKLDIQLGVFVKKQALLLKDHFDVNVIYVQADEHLKVKFENISSFDEGINEQVIYFKPAKGLFKKVLNGLRYKKAQKMAFNQLNKSISISHVHVPYRSAFLALRLNKKGIPFVITEHWSGHLTGEFNTKNWIDKILYKKVLAKAKSLACVSQYLSQAFKSNTGFDSVVIPNYIEKSNSPIKSEKSVNIEILSVSDLSDKVKNISGLIKAFKKAVEKNNNIRLKIIGGGPDEHKIKRLIEELHLTSQVSMLGRLENKAVLNEMQNCDFYICNSNYETFGMTIAEALLSGKPVISTLCGGPNEFLNEENSITINNESALTESILKMSGIFSNYNSISIAKNIESKYGRNTVLEKLISFYDIQ